MVKHTTPSQDIIGSRVFVYYNLHKKCFSIRALTGDKKRLVVAHSPYVLLSNALPSVSVAGMQRVRRTKQKNVHAGFKGTLECLDEHIVVPQDSPDWGLRGGYITYNPYLYDSFVYKNNTDISVDTEELRDYYLHNKQILQLDK